VKERKLDWPEINCLVEALTALVGQYRTRLQAVDLDEDDRADLSNDLAYAEVLQGKYLALREEMAKA